ncbi:MAG: DUF3500 domain-containing protein [Longimicrobiales bacterium]
MRARRIAPFFLIALGVAGLTASLRQQQQTALEPFKGVTTNGTIIPDLFPIRTTGVSTTPVKAAAERFLAALTEEQRGKTTFPVNDDEWRRWNNVHRAARQGVSFTEMSDAQREQAIGLLRASLSAKGLAKSRAIMRLNGHLGQLIDRPEEYTEYLYHITIMGTPSTTEPWGWQLDGHHLDINYFVLGDQVIMTPTFMGSEPVIAESGPHAGTVVLQDEQNRGLAFMRSLTPEQQREARIDTAKIRNNARSQAGQDNLVLDHAGLRVNALSQPQRQLLVDLISEYVGNLDDGHARVRMDEVTRRLADTYFAWIGNTDENSVFYYRIHSPVILIEFDHQTPVALPGPRVPNRKHVHTVVRTPNGNDYGKDLLRQHYEKHRADPAHGHRSRGDTASR